jgi:hypothetical protein
MREIHRRLSELKKENDELKHLLSIGGKNRHDYEEKVDILLFTKNIINFSLFRFNN